MRMLAKDDCGAVLKKISYKDAHRTKYIQLELSQQLFNCDDMKGYFDSDRKIGDGICGMKMLKQNTRERKMEG